MLWSSCGYTFFVLLLWSIVDAHLSPPFDVRIDHHKAETVRDLVINTPRPRFSWKIRVLDGQSQRNVQQMAYQMQLQSVKQTRGDQLFEWDSQQVQSAQSVHVLYTGQQNLFPSTYYRFRVRVWTTESEKPTEWTDWIQFRTPIFSLHDHFMQNSTALWIGSTGINMNELRKEFTVPNASPVKSAIVYISGIGYYELYLNGNKVDLSRKLDPGWTTYYIRTLIVSYDVTSNITVSDAFSFIEIYPWVST